MSKTKYKLPKNMQELRKLQDKELKELYEDLARAIVTVQMETRMRVHTKVRKVK